MPRSGSRIIGFFVVAYSISWTAWFALVAAGLSPREGDGRHLYLFAVFAPHLSALMISAVEDGLAGVRRFYRAFAWHGPLLWGMVAVGTPLLVSLGRDAIVVLLRLPHDALFHPPPSTLTTLLIGQLLVVLGEEPGWRGFALPRLLERFDPIVATLILGVAWATWHLPLFLMPGTPQHGTPFLPFLVELVAWSAVMTLVVTRSQGSIVPAMLFHASANICDFTMWQPDAPVLYLGPWVVTGATAALLIPRKAKT